MGSNGEAGGGLESWVVVLGERRGRRAQGVGGVEWREWARVWWGVGTGGRGGMEEDTASLVCFVLDTRFASSLLSNSCPSVLSPSSRSVASNATK